MKLLERRQKMRGMRGAMKMARRDAYRNSGKRTRQTYSTNNTEIDSSGCSAIFIVGIILFFIIVISSCS
jgi:hypothetical protein